MPDVLLVGAEEFENLSTRYLAAVLRAKGYSVELASFSKADEAENVISIAQTSKPRLIGLSVIFQYRAPEFLDLAAELRRTCPGAHITCGGHFPTFAAPELLRDYPQLDSVVRGEGELTLVELVEKLAAVDKWGSIAGISFRQDGRVVSNPPRHLISDLDSIPFPARDTVPQRHAGIGISPIVGSRGCYRSCSFCSIRAFYASSGGKLQRFRSVSNILDEMELLCRRGGVRFFVFNDDEWFANGMHRYERVAKMEREIRERKLDVIMSIKCRADDVLPDLFGRLLDMGVVRAYVGVESGSAGSLSRMNKRTTVAQNRAALETLHKVGMLADFGLIFFDPDSTVQDIQENLQFLHEMAGEGQAPLSFGRLEVYAGTPILERLFREGRLKGNYLAWNYHISDPRIEMLFRLMIAAMRQRHYANDGIGKQASIACYEQTMYNYLDGDQVDTARGIWLHDIVARLNRNSMAVLEEMLDYVLTENIYNANEVNDQTVRWATRINLFDLDLKSDLTAWREASLDRVALRNVH